MLYVILAVVNQRWVFTEDFFYRSFESEYSVELIASLLTAQRNYNWSGYLLLPVIVIVKVLFTVLCINTGAILTDTVFKFKQVFKASLLAEFVFVISQILFLINLFLNKDVITIETAGNFFPLSLLSFYGAENVASWLHYPFQTLNLFEVAYILCISWLLSKQWKPDFTESINIVLPSYGFGLLIWMVLVVFLTLQIS